MRVPDWQQDPALREILRPGVIYGGFREAPLGLFGDARFHHGPKLMMIRDPRDALVSEYFSLAYSHQIPAKTGEFDSVTKLMLDQRAQAQSLDLQSYVMQRAKSMVKSMVLYAPILSMPNVMVVKYEEMILQKAKLIQRIADHFDMKATPENAASILKWADVIPKTEDPHAMVRQVLPGDHLRKLEPATIGKLNQALAEPMSLFGYEA